MSSASLRNAVRRFRPRRERPTDRASLGLSLLALAAGTAWSIFDSTSQVKVGGVIIIVVVLASLVLSLRGMLILALGVVVSLAAVVKVHGLSTAVLSVSGFAMIAVVLVVATMQVMRRDRLGLRQVSAEKVISLIRDRLLVQAAMPELPDGWTVEIQQRPADGAAIAGDFVSSRLVCDGRTSILHLAVVDVSGNGIAAGPRALLLSGAVGGLLGSVDPDDFLAATNDYLVRQQWSLGFASAIYLRLDLDSGEYSIRVAGHPPAVHFRPGTDQVWRTSPATGTVLGVLPTLTGQVDFDALAPGESVFLYTDGVVEDRTRDIDAGTARLRETVEVLAARGQHEGIARYLIERVPAKHDDDRTVVMIQRAAVPTSDRPTRVDQPAPAAPIPAPAKASVPPSEPAGRSPVVPARRTEPAH